MGLKRGGKCAVQDQMEAFDIAVTVVILIIIILTALGCSALTRGVIDRASRRDSTIEMATVQSKPYSDVNSNFDTCVICLEAFAKDQLVVVIGECGHVFHTDCFNVWSQISNTCAICRGEYVVQLG